MHFIELFDDYPFFYVALINDVNAKADAYLDAQFNFAANPTCYYDGGIENLVGGYTGQDPYRNLIISSGARDVHELDLEISWTHQGGNVFEIIFTVTNNELINSAPTAPTIPSGITDGNAGDEYQFSTSATDDDDNQVYLMWDWGNGDFSTWLGPYNSGEQCDANYTWTTAGSYDVRVKAKDSWDEESDWSSPLTVNIIEYICGDANGDGAHNLLDILYLISFVYDDPPGPAPDPLEAGDANGDGAHNLLDILYLISFVYDDPPGPDPICP